MAQKPLLLALVLCIWHMPLARATNMSSLEAETYTFHPMEGSNQSSTPDAPALEAPEPTHGKDPGMDTTSSVDDTTDPVIWLYSFIPVECGAAALLRHWLQHYLQLGVHWEHFLLLVQYDPAGPGGKKALQQVLGALDEQGMNYRLWLGQYSCREHLRVKLDILLQEVVNPEDWVLLPAQGEFQVYPTPTVDALLQLLDSRGQNWVRGIVEDRVAPDGLRTKISAAPSVFEQFPLHCNLSSHGSSGKVAAMKAYLRTDEGDTHVIEPTLARSYFGTVDGVRTRACPADEDWENLYPLTPYSSWHGRYLYNSQQLEREGGDILWHPLIADYVSLVQRFRCYRSAGCHSTMSRLRRQQSDSFARGWGATEAGRHVEAIAGTKSPLKNVSACHLVDTAGSSCQLPVHNPRFEDEADLDDDEAWESQGDLADFIVGT